MSNRTLLPWFAFVLVSIVLSPEKVVSRGVASAGAGYSIRCVSAMPRRGTRLKVGEHIVLSVTVAYKLTAADTGKIALVLQRDDDSPLAPGHKQVQTEVSRGAAEVTLTDEFDVPTGTSLVRLFIPIVPTGYTQTSGEIVIEYPVKKN